MTFDPYYKWLGIPPEEQPPHHYRLLGIRIFEEDPDVISSAADRQMAHVRSFQTGPNAAVSQTILNEIANARVCLLNRDKKNAYDVFLRREMDAGAVRLESPKAKRKYDPATIGVTAALACAGLIVLGFFLAKKPGQQQAATAVDPPNVALVEIEKNKEPETGNGMDVARPVPAQAEQTVAMKPKEPAEPAETEAGLPESSEPAPGHEDAPEPHEPQPQRVDVPKQPEATAEPVATLAMARGPEAEPPAPHDTDSTTGISDAVLIFSFEKDTLVERNGKLYVKDLSGNGNDGLVQGAQPVEGRVGMGLSFKQKGDTYVECPDAEMLNPKTSMTICLWAKLQGWQKGRSYLVSKEDWEGGQARGYVLRATPRGANYTIAAPGWRELSSEGELELGRWYHIAAAFDGSRMAIFIDGEKRGFMGVDGAISPSPFNLRIGCGNYDKSRKCDGVIDEVAIFGKALTESEVRSVYELGLRGQHLIGDEPSPGLVAPTEPSKATATDDSSTREASPAQRIALLKKELHARVFFDAKTERVTLVYDWTSKHQLEDFDLSKADLDFVRGRLTLQGGESICHKVDFKEVTIAVPVFVPQMKGTLIRTSGGVEAFVGGAHPDTMYLKGGGGETVSMIVPDKQRKGIQPIQVTITPTRLGFAYGIGNPSQLGKAVTDFHAGKVELCGGNVGFQYGRLALTGVIDEKWFTHLQSP